MTHAFFKGLLFLAAGSVIHAVSGEQDMRQMGGLRTKIPWTFWTMTIATFAIAGIPPFAGFFSKDEILWRAYQASWVYWFIGLFTAFLTSFYMFRLWFMTFFGEYRGAARIRITSRRTILPMPTRGRGRCATWAWARRDPRESLADGGASGGAGGAFFHWRLDWRSGALGGSNHFESFSALFFTRPPRRGRARGAAPENESEGTEPQLVMRLN